jgi:hypothetical protein
MAKFQSVLRYGIIFWGVECESIEVFKLQKKALRIIKDVKKYQSCRQIFEKYQILTLTSLYIFEVLCYLKKNKVYNICNYNICEYNTRGKQDLHVSSCKTAGFKKRVIIMSVAFYNRVPNKISELGSLKSFKTGLKKFLLNHMFYSLQEFFNYEEKINL